MTRLDVVGLAAGGFATPISVVGADTPSFSVTLKDHHTPAELIIPAKTGERLAVKTIDVTSAEFESDDFTGGKFVPAGLQGSVLIGSPTSGIC